MANMETEFPLQDLILYRIHLNKPLLELEVFGNFRKELQELIRSGMITCNSFREDPTDYPYDFTLTLKGTKKLFR